MEKFHYIERSIMQIWQDSIAVKLLIFSRKFFQDRNRGAKSFKILYTRE